MISVWLKGADRRYICIDRMILHKSVRLKVEKRKPQKKYYLIAGIVLQLDLPAKYETEKLLPSFYPFRIKERSASPSIMVRVIEELFSVDLQNATLLSDVSAEWGERFRFYEVSDHYITTVVSESEDKVWQMVSTKDFCSSTIHVPEGELDGQSGILSWLLMVAFGQASLCFDAVLVHASVVEDGNRGYAFLGKSGTGKSTHSRLWVQHMSGFRLLNDDNPVVRIVSKGDVVVYGSPWSGKTPCYISKGLKLGGFVRLQQAKENKFEHKRDKEALLQVMPSCTAIRWNASLFDKMVSLLARIIDEVPVGLLSCLPNKEAVSLCHNEIDNRKI